MTKLLTIANGLYYDFQKGDFVATYSGARFSREHLAWSLAGLMRFLGHGGATAQYNVALHSLLVSDILLGRQRLEPQPNACSALIALQGHLHDAREAIIGDITTPLKERFPIEMQATLLEIEEAAHDAICRQLSLHVPIPAKPCELVVRADRAALFLEWQRRFPGAIWGGTYAAQDAFRQALGDMLFWGETSPYLRVAISWDRATVAAEYERMLAVLSERAYRQIKDE